VDVKLCKARFGDPRSRQVTPVSSDTLRTGAQFSSTAVEKFVVGICV
jgi:hypothetical protein